MLAEPNRRTLVVATRNAGKTRELAEMLRPLGIAVRSLNDYPAIPDIAEDGATFADNAFIKAQTVSRLLGTPALADDSGLCVEALDGQPGVYSARYGGPGAKDADNNAKLLRELGRLTASGALVPSSADVDGTAVRLLSPASFVCALSLYVPDAPTLRAEGRCDGYIIDKPLGTQGFGYDPLFFLPAYGQTMAQLPPERKNAISHRARALAGLRQALEDAEIG